MDLENRIVVKRNALNEMRETGMTLQELRFFSIYLAGINSKDSNTRVQSFKLSEFKKIMDLGRVNIDYLKSVTRRLMQRVITIDTDEGYDQFYIFSKCTCKRDKNDNWVIEFCASEDAIPLLFDFKKEYFKYELWNALGLDSKNQLRMYEILKQYEKNGSRRISVDDLRALLGIADDKYIRFNNFKMRVLDSCQKALEEKTNIKYTYDLIKSGKGGSVKYIDFKIEKNENYKDKLNLKEYISNIDTNDECIDITEFEEKTDGESIETEMIGLLFDACNGRFNQKEIEYIFDLIVQVPAEKLPDLGYPHDTLILMRFHYLKNKYDKMVVQKNDIENHFKYLCKMIEEDIPCNVYDKTNI